MALKEGESKIVFLGTGVSEGIPRVTCLIKGDCKVCMDAHHTPNSKNKRRTISTLIWHENKAVVIDVGKFFWQSAMDHFPILKPPTINAILITHDHADAFLGLDDLRDFTMNGLCPSLPVYIRSCDEKTISSAFPYLFKQTSQFPGTNVAEISFEKQPEEAGATFEAGGLNFQVVPLVHGKTGCNGYVFDACGLKIAYMSDVKEVLPASQELVTGSDVMILDLLRITEPHPTHFILPDALAYIKSLSPLPKYIYFIGMMHHIDHEEMSETLRKFAVEELQGRGKVLLAYDGMQVDLGAIATEIASLPN
eukprot:Colp12_sorted_trinity150504_noHs@32761